MKKKPVVVVTHAVKEEFFPLMADGYEIIHLYTGVGKTKSAHVLTRQICLNPPDLVLNIGTAGTLKHQVGDIFVSARFIDRDYEAVRLPGLEHEIDGFHLLQAFPLLANWICDYEKNGICNTGDSFVTQAGVIQGDIIDMEAYAQAYVCQESNVPFVAVKYITDIIGQNSVKLWESRLNEARNSLNSWFIQQDFLKQIGI